MEFIDNIKQKCIDNGNVPVEVTKEDMAEWWKKFKENAIEYFDRNNDGTINPFSKEYMPEYMQKAVGELETLRENGAEVTKTWRDKFVNAIEEKIDQSDLENSWIKEAVDELKQKGQNIAQSEWVQNALSTIKSAYEDSQLAKIINNSPAVKAAEKGAEIGREVGENIREWAKDRFHLGVGIGEKIKEWGLDKFNDVKIGLENAKKSVLDNVEIKDVQKVGSSILIGGACGGAGIAISNIDFKEKFQEIAEKGKTTYEQLIEKAKPYWDQAIDKIEATYEKVFDKEIDLDKLISDGKEKAVEFGKDAKEFGQAVISDVTPVIDLAKKEFNEHIVEPFKNYDGKWYEKAAHGFDPIVDWTKEAANRTVDEIRDQTQFWKDYDGNIFERFQDGLQPIGEKIQDLGENAWEKFQTTATWDKIEPVYEAAKNKIEPVVDWVQEAGEKTVEEIKDQAQFWKDHDGNIFEKARDGFEPIGQKIQDFGENAVEKLQDWGGQVKDWGAKAWDNIENFFDRD